MKDSILLFSNFMRRPKEVGAIAPSSRSLTKSIVSCIDFQKAEMIVELGPGLGTFTKAILEKAGPKARLVCFEINNKFCSYLKDRIDDKRLIIINSGAESIIDELKRLNIKSVDCIVSGLPFRNFPNEKKHRILKQIKNLLNEDGKFILFQYTNSIVKVLRKYFTNVGKKFVALNIPPSFVYICKK